MRRLVAAAIATAMCSAPAAAPAPSNPRPPPAVASQRIGQLDDWLLAVRAHEPGALDSALYRLASWSNSQIRTLWVDVQTLVHFVRCPKCNATTVIGLDGRVSRVGYTHLEVAALREMAAAIRERAGDDNQVLKRGAILHADVVMYAQPTADPIVDRSAATRSSAPTPAPERIILRSSDGRPDSLITDAVHWDIAYSLLAQVTDVSGKIAPAADDTVRLWYRATIAYLQNTSMHDPVHFQRALGLFPGDADIQFQAGCLHESLASARVQEAVRTATMPTGVTIAVKSERGELETAERFFRRALEIDPAHHESRLRLGRVLGLLDRHDQAAAELRQVPDDVDDLTIRYYTALFLGHEEEALGHRDAARAAYEHAGALFPLAQSPQIALSHLAREAGDRAAALASAQRVLNLPVNEMDRRDPFWIYHFVQGRHVDELLDELYRPFRSRREEP